MPEPVHPSIDAAFLGNLAASLSHVIADNQGGVLVHVIAHEDGPEIAILPLDGLAPADALLGAVAPAQWAVLGVATGGRVRSLDRPRSVLGRAEVVVLVARDGQVVSRMRHGEEVITEPPAYGVTLDCLQRALGLPAAPPADPTVDWGRLRQAVIEGGRPQGGLTPEEAAWLDDGAFSRWVGGLDRLVTGSTCTGHQTGTSVTPGRTDRGS